MELLARHQGYDPIPSHRPALVAHPKPVAALQLYREPGRAVKISSEEEINHGVGTLMWVARF